MLDPPFLRALTEPARLDLPRVLLLLGPANIGTLDRILQRAKALAASCCPP